MEKLALGIIGLGNMGYGHIRNIAAGLVPEVEVAAICDIDPSKLDRASLSLPKAARYADAEKMMDEAKLDAVLIATPHYLHPVYAIEAFKRGLNVLTEKPAGVYTKAVREMNEAAEKSGKVFGIMYNQRTNPVYQKLRDLIQSGELGEIKRTNWIITNWYRSQAYYNSGGWRATWSGEGGGVLLNQDPHQLDLWQWTCGLPVRVRAFMQFGKGRDIEVENDVTAYVEYENGATGLFVTVLSNFANAVLKGEKLLAPGVEGIRGLTLSNAMHLSAWTDKTIELATLDEDLFYDLLQEKIKTSKFVKPAATNRDSGAV